MRKLIIIGAGGHGKVAADIAKKNGYGDICFLDDNPQMLECGGNPVVGQFSDAENYPQEDFFVAIGNGTTREEIQKRLNEKGFRITTLIHPSAAVADDVIIDQGTIVMAGAVINPGACLGPGVILNTCASVDHDCRIGAYVHISVGAHVAGTVAIGDRTCIGAGATVINNVEVAGNCVIGAGAVVIKNITEIGTYVGVPAKRI